MEHLKEELREDIRENAGEHILSDKDRASNRARARARGRARGKLRKLALFTKSRNKNKQELRMDKELKHKQSLHLLMCIDL